MTGIRDYSGTAASNLSVGGISIAEGMARSSVNNAMRSGMADLANLLLDQGGATATTGSANSYLLSLPSSPSSYSDNLFFLATSHASNTGASTLNVSGLGVKAIEKLTAGAAVPIGAQDFPAGHVGIFTYSSASNSFLMLNPATALAVGAQSVSFETRSAAATAIGDGTIPDSIDIIEVLGYSTPGDDTNRPYTREVADPGTGSRYEDADGSWWVAAAQGLHRVDGVAALRTYAPIAGRRVMLAYHTTADDLGAGLFVGRTGLAPGAYTDNDGTIIVPTGGDGSTAWLRVWDGVTAHVGWFGATCNGVTDDYAAVFKALSLYTDGRTSTGRTGALDVGPGFAFGTPLIYGGANACGFKLFGSVAHARSTPPEVSRLVYIGPAADGAIYLYGANETVIENLNIYPNLALNNLCIIADNVINTTLSASVTAGTNVVATPAAMTWLNPGCFLGIDAGGPNFEIVLITKVTATTFTATFLKNHAAGVQVGGGAPSSGVTVNRCRILCPESKIWTTIPADTPGGAGTVFTPASMTGIKVGMPIRVGSFNLAEIVYPTAVTATTFTADCNQSHAAGDIVMYATAAVFVGNKFTGTPQVSELSFSDVYYMGQVLDRCYAGIRQVQGGNVKNMTLHDVGYAYLHVPFAIESGSGQYSFQGVVGAACYDTIFQIGTGTLTVIGLEDESLGLNNTRGAMLIRAGAGTSPCHATFIGSTFQTRAPALTNDQITYHLGQLTFIGCDMFNTRTASTFPVIVVGFLRQEFGASGLVLINCAIWNATKTSAFVTDTPAPALGGVDIIKLGDGNLTMLGCKGGSPGGGMLTLPSMIPSAYSRWQKTIEDVDEASIAAGGVSSIHAAGVPGAAMGDLVEASFSSDLQGIRLDAWVSAADVVNYQFSNPRGGAIDLAFGDSEDPGEEVGRLAMWPKHLHSRRRRSSCRILPVRSRPALRLRTMR